MTLSFLCSPDHERLCYQRNHSFAAQAGVPGFGPGLGPLQAGDSVLRRGKQHPPDTFIGLYIQYGIYFKKKKKFLKIQGEKRAHLHWLYCFGCVELKNK